MVDERLAYAPATDLLELIAAKQVSPVELAEMFFKRIDRLDPQLNSFLLVTRDLAMEQARAAEDAVMRGDKLGALHGLPVPIKDTQMTAGVRTTMGSVVYENRVPERNSAVAERVLNAGAVMLGKTNVPEFGMVGCCENSLGVLGHNPWNTDRTPGGSSGGAAAAVAAYLCPVATGSDGGRFPPHTRQLLRHLHHQADPGPRVGLHGTGRASHAEHLLSARPLDADCARRRNSPSGIGGIRPS